VGRPIDEIVLNAALFEKHGVSVAGAIVNKVDLAAQPGIEAVLERVDCVYVALDCDVFEPSELAVFMPEPGGPTIAEVEKLFCGLRDRGVVVGAGLTGLAPDPANVEKLERLATALGF